MTDLQLPVCPSAIKKCAKMSVFTCESRKNPLVAGDSAPRRLVAVVHIERHSCENIYETRVVPSVQLCRRF